MGKMNKASRCLHCVHNEKTKCDLGFEFFNLKAARKCSQYADKRALNKALKKSVISSTSAVDTVPETKLDTKDKPRVRFFENEKVKFFFYV